jgi:hypothetical protein
VTGLPITPVRLLDQLRGESFCVSYAAPEQLAEAIRLQDPAGMLLLDNGAFSAWKKTGAGWDDQSRAAYFAWANAAQECCPVAVAVIPDVIAGATPEKNWLEAAYAVRGALARFPDRLMFIWHLDEPLEQLERAARLFNFVGFGSCAKYDVQTARAAYLERMREAYAVLERVEAQYGRRPWVHLMRGVGVLPAIGRADSADSTNIARNHCRTKGEPGHVERFYRRIADQVQGACRAWGTYPAGNFFLPQPQQLELEV